MEADKNKEEKPPKPSCCTRFKTSMRNFGRFVFNPETKEILGRTGFSWLQVLSFYLGFYCILAGFWATCMVVFIRTLDPNVPTMNRMFSMMKDNPGMSFEPFAPGNGTTLISFDPTDSATYSTYVAELTAAYEQYYNQSDPSVDYKMNCKPGDGATPTQACWFHLSTLGDICTPQNQFGYPDGLPCVMLRINRVFFWEPNNITLDKLDCNGAKSITDPLCAKKLEFLNITSNTRTDMSPSYIGVSCQGENDGDMDNIISVTFYPSGGFPSYFFPYLRQPGYMSPMVMAQFKVFEGRVSMILCKVWTRDIIHDKNDLQGSIHFELMVGLEKK